MKAFLDTNVLLDFMCQREPFYNDAYNLFRKAAKHEIDVVVSALTIVNVRYIAPKYGYSADQVNVAINNLLSLVSVSPINEDIVVKAFSSADKDKEDTIQYLSANSVKCDFIITRDPKGFTNSIVPTLSPSAFLSQYGGL